MNKINDLFQAKNKLAELYSNRKKMAKDNRVVFKCYVKTNWMIWDDSYNMKVYKMAIKNIIKLYERTSEGHLLREQFSAIWEILFGEKDETS